MSAFFARFAVSAALGPLLALPPIGGHANPLASGSRLCPYPVVLPLSESEAEKRRPHFRELLEASFLAASLTLADPASVAAIEERVRGEVGFIDPATGMRDVALHRDYQERLAMALEEELGCAGQLTISVMTVHAPYAYGVARWDGVSRTVSSTGRRVMNALAGVHESGWVSAFSLWIEVADLLGNSVAFRSAGIETLVHFAVLEDKDLVPEDVWLTDRTSLNEAIRSALGQEGRALRSDGKP